LGIHAIDLWPEPERRAPRLRFLIEETDVEIAIAHRGIAIDRHEQRFLVRPKTIVGRERVLAKIFNFYRLWDRPSARCFMRNVNPFVGRRIAVKLPDQIQRVVIGRDGGDADAVRARETLHNKCGGSKLSDYKDQSAPQ